MKKLYMYLLIVVFTTPLCAQTYSGGSGTANDPYLISSKADMETLANAVNNGNNYSYNKYFLLTQNLTGITTVIGNLGSSYAFQGTFDGGGYTINASIVITYPSYNFYLGIFGFIQGATIRNLNVLGSVTAENVGYYTKGGYMGGICGYASASTFINCNNNASIYAAQCEDSHIYTGGICGYSTGSNIDNCYNNGGIAS